MNQMRITSTCLLFLALLAFWIPVHGQTVLNGGFEDTTFTVNDTLPTHWSGDFFGFGFTSDAHSGAAAASVWNWYTYAKGWLVYGDAVDPYTGGGLPIAINPASLSGFYKYVYDDNGGAADSAICEILLYSHQGGPGGRDTIAHVIHKFGPIGEYTAFMVPITYSLPGSTADTIVIRFMSSESGQCNPTNECLYLYLDDLELNSMTGTTSLAELMPAVSVYPSPSTGGLRVRTQDLRDYPLELRLLDVQGREVYTAEIATPTAQPLHPNVEAGVYLWQVTASNGKAYFGKLIVQ